MNLLIFINMLIELAVGITLLIVPDILPAVAEEGSAAIFMSQMYGVAAFTIGFISGLVLWKNSDTTLLKVFLLSMAPFHLGAAIVTLLAHQGDLLPNAMAPIFHVLMALSFAFMLFQTEVRKTNS